MIDSFWDDLSQNLTTELIGSIVVFFAFRLAASFVEDRRKNRHITTGLVVSTAVLLFLASPLGSRFFPSLHDDFTGGMALSLGIEFVGALVTLVALDRVVRLLQDQGHREKELIRRLDSLGEVVSRPSDEEISGMTRQIQHLRQDLEKYHSLKTRVVGVLGQGRALSAETILYELNRGCYLPQCKVTMDEVQSIIGTLVKERKVHGDHSGYLTWVEDAGVLGTEES